MKDIEKFSKEMLDSYVNNNENNSSDGDLWYIPFLVFLLSSMNSNNSEGAMLNQLAELKGRVDVLEKMLVG